MYLYQNKPITVTPKAAMIERLIIFKTPFISSKLVPREKKREKKSDDQIRQASASMKANLIKRYFDSPAVMNKQLRKPNGIKRPIKKLVAPYFFRMAAIFSCLLVDKNFEVSLGPK